MNISIFIIHAIILHTVAAFRLIVFKTTMAAYRF